MITFMTLITDVQIKPYFIAPIRDILNDLNPFISIQLMVIDVINNALLNVKLLSKF